MRRARPGATLLLLPEVFAGIGGIQRFGRGLVEALVRAAPDSRVAALVLNDPPAAVAAGWPGREARGCGGRRLVFAASALAMAARIRPRLVIVAHRNLVRLAPLLALASRGSSRVLFLYGVEAGPTLGPLERLALRWVQRLVAVSPQTAEAFRVAGATGAIEVWPCCLPADWDLPPPSPPALDPPRRLLSVARLAASDGYKGIDHTIGALAALPPGSAVLDVVGDGDDRPRLERAAVERGVADSVRFHGALPDAELRALYAACDVFVLPSGGEGFGIVYLEAMAHAKPVVAADAGGVPFVVRHGETGWLVPYGRPEELARRLEAVFSDPDAARRVGLAGRSQVEGRFSFDAMVRRAAELLRAEEEARCASST